MNPSHRRLRSGLVGFLLLVLAVIAGWLMLSADGTRGPSAPVTQEIAAIRPAAPAAATVIKDRPAWRSAEVSASAMPRDDLALDELGPRAPGFTEIRGRVVDAPGEPVVDAEVRLVRPLNDQLRIAGRAHTGGDGRFALPVAHADSYGLIVGNADESLIGQVPAIAVSIGDVVDVGDVRVLAARRLSGRVVDDHGFAIQGAAVCFESRKVETDAKGLFDGVVSQADGVRVAVLAGGFRPWADNLPTRSETIELQIQLTRSPALLGIVTDTMSQPLAQARVLLDPLRVTHSAADGRFSWTSLDAMDEAWASVVITHPAGVGHFLLRPGIEETCMLTPGPAVLLTVVGGRLPIQIGVERWFGSGNGIEGFQDDPLVLVEPGDGSPGRSFLVPWLEPGARYRLRIVDADGSMAILSETPAPGTATAPLLRSVTLPEPRRVVARVTRQDGQPIPDAQVLVQPLHQDCPVDGIVVDRTANDDGRFELPTFDCDSRIRIRAAGFAPLAVDLATNQVGPAATFVLLAAARIAGKIAGFDADGPAVSVAVAGQGIRRRVGVDGAGCFNVGGLPEGLAVVALQVGAAALEAGGDVDPARSRVVELIAGQTAQVEFTMEDLTRRILRVSVRDDAGQGLAQVPLQAQAADGTYARKTFTDADGVATFGDLLPGLHRLGIGLPGGLIAGDGFGQQCVIDMVGDRSHTVILRQGGLAVTALDPEGRALAGVEITPTFLDTPTERYGSLAPSVTDATGVARFVRLPAGSYRNDAEHADRHWSGTASVAGSAITAISLAEPQ